MNNALLLRHVGPEKNSEERDPIERLSSREFEVFRLIGKGMQPREIANALHLSVKTVETHRMNMRRKLEVADARELARFAVSWMRTIT